MTNKKIEKIPDGEPWEYQVNFNFDEATLFLNELDDIESIKQDNPLFWETLSKVFKKVKIEVVPRKKPEQSEELVENVIVKYPDSFLITTDILTRELPFQKLDDISIKLSRGSDKAITGNIVIEPAFESELTKQLPSLTPEHLLYLKGVCRLYDAGIKIFTPDMVYRFSVGDSKAEVRPDKRERVANHIDDMRRMIPNINITELMKQYHKIDKQEERPVFISDNLLSKRGIYVRTGR